MDSAFLMSKKRKKFILFTLVLVFALIFAIFSDMPVFAVTAKDVDNDDAQGNSNSWYDNNWTYLSANSCYYNDARKHATGEPPVQIAYWYRYTYQTQVAKYGTIYANLSVWLNHNDFTDSATKYYIQSSGNSVFMLQIAGYLNQNLAPGGWSNFNTTTISTNTPGDYIVSKYVQLAANTVTGMTTGADFIRVNYQNC